MRFTLLVLKWLFFSGCLLFLTQCSQVSQSEMRINGPEETPFALPAATYLAMADEASGVKRQELKLMAAGRLIKDGQWPKARLILTQLKDLSPKLHGEKNLLQAEIAEIRGQPQTALAQLSGIKEVNELSLYQKTQYHKLLAKAYKTRGNAMDAVHQRMKLGALLTDEKAKKSNYRDLWLSLITLPDSELETQALEKHGAEEALGWMRLALIAKQDYQTPDSLNAALNGWRYDFPDHLASQFISWGKTHSLIGDKPGHIALLLPLSGSLAGPGSAIRDGFMTALKKDKTQQKPQVLVYDTHAHDVSTLYQEAIHAGAQFVVGPLLKDDVQRVAALKHPVPTLFLNELEHKNLDGFSYQFGLSPSDEAREVAVKARDKGHARALVIAPADLWGEEVLASFSGQWQAAGGIVADVLRYNNKDSLNHALRGFLQITDSERRQKELENILGHKLSSVPRRRQDFDMVFLLAYPSKARQILPLLKYYYAGDVPVYATSSVYAGHLNPLKDRDLNGIIFCDMPWVLTHQMDNKHWPEWFNSYSRLYALGKDSYALSMQLNKLQVFPAMNFEDKNSMLYLAKDGTIKRVFAWGQFKSGVVHVS